METKRIIDVSEHQGVINWEKVKADGIDGAIIRCGFGQNKTGQDDKQFKRNADECSRLNIPFGVYLYSYAKTAAKAQGEAEHALRLVKGYKLALPIFYDLEEQFTETVAAAKARIFTDIITRAGYTAGVYASLSWFKNYLKNYADGWRWVAAWGTNSGEPQTKPAGTVDVWQYTSRGTVAGINGRVDANLLYRDFIGSIAATAPTRPMWQRRRQIYYTVKAGDTLGKIARAHRTTVAHLVELNGIKNKNLIITGQKIRIK